MSFTGRSAIGDERKPGPEFQFVGNRLCLEFVNTRVVSDGRQVDLLKDPADLGRWLVEAGIAKQREGGPADLLWDEREGDQVFERALVLRDALLEMVQEIISGKPVGQRVIDEINGLLRSRPGYRQVVKRGDSFEMQFLAESESTVDVLVPIAESAARLLVEGDLSRVKKCGNPACILHFYDTSKNHTRRWCSMRVCGNRMKAAAHYRRRRAARS